MLRSYTTDVPFRALSTRPFVHKSTSCVLGSRTVIYGRNGSGKTTFSELLRCAARGTGNTEGAAISCSIRVNSVNSTALLGSRDFDWAIHVYNRYYVLESLQLFLDGERGSPSILKLGAPNIEAAEKLRSIREGALVLAQRHQMVEATRKRLFAERDASESKAKSDIISALSVSDPLLYNSTRFRIDRVRVLLRESSAKPLSDDAVALEIEVASAPLLGPVKVPGDWPEVPASLRRTINEELLGLVVDSQPIAQLAENAALSDWVETGLAFHKAGDVCGFCQQGTVSETVLLDYAHHFSQALSALRTRLRVAISYFEGVQGGIDNFLASLPREDELLVEYRDESQSTKSSLAAAASTLRAQIDEAIAMIKERLADPLKPVPAARRVTDDFVTLDTSELLALLNANNQAWDEQATRKKRAEAEVEAHFGASHGEGYRHALTRIALADRAMSTISAREDQLRTRENELEQAQEDTGRMAGLIDGDLHEHFGLSHLNVVVSEDRKGYVIRRGKVAAKRLSEGERNAIAFSYFLRSLEAEGVDPLRTLVVIDDPVTSMDKESLFAAFALAEERTKDFGQTVFLTHDYEYFRLQLAHLKSRREKSEKKIREGNHAEEAFPGVAILEIAAILDAESGRRMSTLRKLPPGLLQHPSEYHYLFCKVAEAVAGDDPETLPLLGNAARRLLDGFIAFRAPNGNDFQSRVDSIVRDSQMDGVLARRVVKFLHGQSHREEPRPTSALDFPTISSELKSALQFMLVADSKHFGKMCKAVGIDENALALIVPTKLTPPSPCPASTTRNNPRGHA